MPRALWKGAITFGLVHIPVALYPASKQDELDFDWIDRRNMAPVGYKRVNKETGREVAKENIVKGLEYEDGKYVVLSDAEIKAANAKATQTIDIVAFVDCDAIPNAFFDTPYFVSPGPRGDKVYALLRETLKKEKKAGVAYVVIATRQHLGALMPVGNMLMLYTLRWASELRDAKDIDVPSAGLKGAGVRDNELKMASQLVKDMTEAWKPDQYKDQFHDDIMALVKKKVAAGKTEEILEPAKAKDAEPSNVVDLTELLKKSLGAAKGGKPKPAARARRTSAAKTAHKSAAARKRAA